jgi:lysophospholipase L1-like esterase
MIGTNDARPWLPVPSGLGLSPGDPGYPGTFKDNMQRIINLINGAGKEVCLAKPPITLGETATSTPYPDPDSGARSMLIKEYNQVIDGLYNTSANGITVVPPDFYTLFSAYDPGTGKYRYESEYSDNLHPNGLGYSSMVELWFQHLTQ